MNKEKSEKFKTFTQTTIISDLIFFYQEVCKELRISG